jgi:hypothetical protein
MAFKYVRCTLVSLFTMWIVSGIATADTLAICEQNVEYRVDAPDAQVPQPVRAFSGVWVGNWEGRICSALIVESILPDGTARIIYVHGTVTGQYPLKANQYRYTAKIAGNRLTNTGTKVSHEYVLQSPGELSGKHVANWGTLNGKFARR